MSEQPANKEPWELYDNGQVYGKRSTREAAMNLVGKPYRSGFFVLVNVNTGEQWERRKGSWIKTNEATKVKRGEGIDRAAGYRTK
jgi:hypothetical protein